MSSGRRRGQRFDAEHHVTTEALIFLGQLDPEEIGDALEDATHYEPVPIDDFHRLIAAIPEPLERYTFVDAGSGMGRAVMLAARYPFRQIVGVEVSRALHEVATENLQRWRTRDDVRCRDIRLVCADATAFDYPHGDVVLFLYNPFGAASTATVVDRAATAATGEFVVAYHTALHVEALGWSNGYESLAHVNFGVVYRRVRS